MICTYEVAWWRHQMETFSALLALCAGNSPIPGEFPTQRPVTRSFDVLFHLHLNERLNQQSWGWWFQTSSHALWRHCNVPWVTHSFHFVLALKVLSGDQSWILRDAMCRKFAQAHNVMMDALEIVGNFRWNIKKDDIFLQMVLCIFKFGHCTFCP